MCLTGFTGAVLRGAVTVVETDVNKDSYKDIMLENDYVKLIFQPALGGRCTSFYYKPAAKEMISNTDSAGGLFTDSTWPGGQSDYAKAHYEYKIRRDSDGASIEMWAMGKTGFLSFVEIRKKITLCDKSSVITAEYKLTNTPSSMSEFEIGLQICNFTAIEKGARYFYTPTGSGVKKEIYDGKTQKEAWQTDMADGWSAVISESKAGLAFVTDYKYLSNFYEWYDGSGFATFEWWCNAQNLSAGDSFETTFYVVPFIGMPRVDKAYAWGIIGLDDRDKYTPGKTEEKVSITSKCSQDVVLAWKLINPKTSGIIGSGSEKLNLTAEAVAESKIRFNIPENGQYMLDITFTRGDEIIGNMVKMIGAGTAALPLKPVCEGIGLKYVRAANSLQQINSEKEYKLREDSIRNAVRWAKPYSRGKLKCLILSDIFNQRELLELAARFDLDWDTVKLTDYTNDSFYYKYSPGDHSIKTHEDAMLRLKDKLAKNDYDVIMVAGLRQGVLDKEVVDAIEKKVKNGTGFMLVDIEKTDPTLLKMAGVSDFKNVFGEKWKKIGNHYIVNGINSWDLYPENVTDTAFNIKGEVLATAGKHNLLGISKYGKGKIAVFGYKTRKALSTGLTPVFRDHEVVKEGLLKKDYPYGFCGIEFPTYNYWENYYALLGKAIIWAGNKQPNVEIESILTNNNATEITIQNNGKPDKYMLDFSMLNKHSQPEGKVEKDVTLSQGKNKITIPCEMKSTGLHLVNVRLLKDGKVVDYGTGDFVTATGTSIGKITPGKELYNVGESVSGNISFNNNNISPKAKCRIRLYDYYGRLINEVTKPVKDAAMPFTLDAPADRMLDSLSLKIEAAVLNNGNIIDEQDATVLVVPSPVFDDYRVGLWGGVYSWQSFRPYHYPEINKVLHDLGVDAVIEGGKYDRNLDQELAAKANFRNEMMSLSLSRMKLYPTKNAENRANYSKTGDIKYLVRPFCYNNPDDQAKEWNAFETNARYAVKNLGTVTAYSVGDEMGYVPYQEVFDYCFCPYCMADFRKWTKEQYGNLENLNKEWNTRFASWDEVRPMTYAETSLRTKSKNYAPWADHRTYNEYTWARHWKRVRDVVKKYDKNGKLCMSGTQLPSAYNGFDYYRLGHGFDMLDSYGQTKVYGDIERAMINGPLIWWTGYCTEENEAQAWWQMLNSNEQPIGINIYDVSTIFYADMNMTASGVDMAKWIKEFKSGIAKLRMNVKRTASPVAVHYSMPSVHGAFISDKLNYYNDNMAAWNRLIKDIGQDLDYVAYKQIEDGDLLKKKYKVLILPYSCAISAKEANAIEDFVRAGGTVIADTSCGVFDEHCKWQKNKGMLDDLLGITARTDKKPRYVNVENVNAIGMKEGGRILALEDVRVSGDVLAGNEANFPIVSCNTVGNGKAIFLNFDLTGYGESIKKGSSRTLEWYRGFLKDLFAYSGLKDDFPMQCAKPQIRLEKTLYSEGGNTYIGVIRLLDANDTAGPEEITIGLPGMYNVYDIRDKKYLGRLNEIKTTINGNSAKFFAILPYKVEGIDVTGDDKAKPGDTVKFKMNLVADSKNGGRHIFHVDVYGSDGKLLKHYGKNVVAESGVVEYGLPISLNDASGVWKICAVDVATGAKGEKAFEVTPR